MYVPSISCFLVNRYRITLLDLYVYLSRCNSFWKNFQVVFHLFPKFKKQSKLHFMISKPTVLIYVKDIPFTPSSSYLREVLCHTTTWPLTVWVMRAADFSLERYVGFGLLDRHVMYTGADLLV